MTVAVSTAGPYYSSGPISFGSLRQNFRAQVRKISSSVSETFDGNDNGPISASDLRRNTQITATNPIVPDSTENQICGVLGFGITTGNNLAISQFRNSIKYYYITQTGTETLFDIDSPPAPGTWNSNLTKNINKIMFIEGECGSSTVASPAASFNTTAYNLTIDVHGNIFGSGGRGGGTGGGAPDPAGEGGGTALEILSDGTTTLNVTQTYNTISGVDSNLLSLDIYYNSNISITKPVVIYIHGGGFAVGDKQNVDSKASFFTGLGYIFASINYRLSPAANLVLPYNLFVGDNNTVGTASTRVKHTNHVTDCANAITWIYNNISSYGGDANKLILMGHSGGAVLASLLVTNQSYLTTAGLPSGKILGCISNDTESYNVLQQITDPIQDGDAVDQQKMAMNAFGIYPDKTVTGTVNNVTTDFATTAAAAASYATGSAILNISASTPPFLVLCRGASERITRETEFVTALQNAGRPVTAVTYPGDTTYDHFEINESIGAVNDPPIGNTLPSGIANVTSQIQNWITSIAAPPAALPVTGNNIKVYVRDTGKIYGGGGGGERGKVGDNGQPGTCNDSYTAENCGGCPDCAGGWTAGGCWSGGGCNRRQECNWWGNCWWVTSQWNHYRTCSKTYPIAGGDGGAGGLGGPGRGFANQSGSLLGQPGSPGAADNGCGSTAGIQGDTGGAGGEWATSGEDTLNTAAGGPPGKAIVGKIYVVEGTVNTDTVKGQYLAS